MATTFALAEVAKRSLNRMKIQKESAIKIGKIANTVSALVKCVCKHFRA